MNKVFSKYLRGDSTVWLVFILLCVISTVELYSASSTLAYKQSNHSAPIIQHVVFLLGGAFIAYLVHFIHYKYIRVTAYLGLIISFVLLVYVQIRAEAVNDAKRWIDVFGIQFQPSEIAKLSLVIVVADIISRIRANPYIEKKFFWVIIGISLVIIGLIFTENFSTAAILGTVVFAMMFVGQISFKRLGALLGVVVGSLLLGYIILKTIPEDSKVPEQLKRAKTWVNRIDRAFDSDEETRYEINDENRQVQNGRIAVARGKFFGVMPGNSVQRDYLSHAYDDFIFAIILEEMGLVGGIFVMFLYLVLIFRTGQIATVCRSSFPAMLVTGLGMIITLQATVNMIVGSGLGLVTGQPLPMISRGGTSILITSVYFGIILGVIRQIKEENNTTKKPDEETVVDIDDLTIA